MVALRADAMPGQEVIEIVDRLALWDTVSPREERFFRSADLDDEEACELEWGLEALVVLLWTLGHIQDLDWPRGMCDVASLVKILKPAESDPRFVSDATLRSVREVLDAQDLTMRIHWAIRDAYINSGGFLPADLDWSKDYELARVGSCPAVGVVEQRHKTLNWLIGCSGWDTVDTPT